MAHYGIVQKDIFTYMGFHKNRHNFYVFFDISNIWVNHHYLSMNDPFWTVNVSEIIDTRIACCVTISPIISNMFYTNSSLKYLLDYKDAKKSTL